MMRLFIFISIFLTLNAFGQKYGYEKGCVVSAHRVASEVGVKILKQGGNAVDAAVAVHFALAVVYPEAGNIGGGGFLFCRKNDGQVLALDFREKAPSKASKNMYLDSLWQVKEGLSLNGHLAAGVPGSVAGMFEAHRKLGKLTWTELLQPAIELARNGVLLSPFETFKLNWGQNNFMKYNTVFPKPFVEKSGDTLKKWKEGELFKQPQLAKTLETIQKEGVKGFYEGWVADSIVAEMKRGKGLITHQDLLDYQPIWREPLTANYKNFTILTMPPPSSGGVCLLQMLKMIENQTISKWEFDNPEIIHTITEAMRRAYSDRTLYLGDPDYFKIPVEELLNANYLKNKMSNFNPNKTTPFNSLLNTTLLKSTTCIKECEETTHFSIVDSAGNAVAVTTTLNGSFGSSVVVSGAGFFLNNEMDDFSIKTGVGNMYGLVGGKINAVASGKRMLSSMTPTIVLKDKQLYLVLGSPGGSTIINSVLQVILNVVELGMDIQKAVSEPRFHHQWLPDKLDYEENRFSEITIKKLTEKGQVLSKRRRFGRVDAILIKEGKKYGGADPRGEDVGGGY